MDGDNVHGIDMLKLTDAKGSDRTNVMIMDEMFSRGVILRDSQMRNAMVQAPSKVRWSRCERGSIVYVDQEEDGRGRKARDEVSRVAIYYRGTLGRCYAR